MHETNVSALMEREHHEIDQAIEHFVAGLSEGKLRHKDLARAGDLLKRHIYVEEELIFPTLRAKGMLAPVLVMLREHGEIWRTLDALDLEVGPGTAAEWVPDRCHQLLRQLETHNGKEEPIIYPQADALLTDEQTATVREFLHSGTMPLDWVCAQAPNG